MAIAVLDVGKTNVKLLVVGGAGDILDEASVANACLADGPFRRHDLAGTERWLLETLGTFGQRHALAALVTSGHGSAGVLVEPVDLERPEPACPMLDYEQEIPDWLRDAYVREGGGFEDRGSAIMLAATHPARQMLWIERDLPAAFASATMFLSLPQYWAWRLCGVGAAEITSLAAQSGLWNLRRGTPSRIVERRGWTRLLPPMRRAWETLGTLRPELARETSLPKDLRILTGIHDSSANFYGYQAMGFADFAVISTGTWIVGMKDNAAFDAIDPARGMTTNADPQGNMLGGVLSMGGREFSAVTGETAEDATTTLDAICAVVAQGTMALPTFGADDGLFPGTAGRGRIVGPPPEGDVARKSLGVLHCALLTSECLQALGPSETIILDGSYLRDPHYAGLVAALNPGRRVLENRRADGVALGAAQLATHGADRLPVQAPIDAAPLVVPGLKPYARTWRSRAVGNSKDQTR